VGGGLSDQAPRAREFVVHACLGQGGFGEVYRATMRSLGGLDRVVAVKLLRVDIDAEGDAVRRLRDEGRLLAALDHPAILRVMDVIGLDGRVALVAEFVDGFDLADCFRDQPLGHRALLQVTGAVAEALQAAFHTVGPGGPYRVVHRDLKPANVRLGRHGEVKLLDFGVARFEGPDREARTATGTLVGTLPYMAPERFSRAVVEPPSDIFSLGATLYEGLVGRRFYAGASVRDIGALSMDERGFAAYRDRRGEGLAQTPEPLRRLVLDMLSFEARHRPSAAEVVERCDELAEVAGGPNLRSYCRNRPSRPPIHIEGSLVGRTLCEGRLGLSDPEPAGNDGLMEVAPPARSRRRAIALAAGFGCMGLVVLGAVLTGLVAILVGWMAI